MISSVTRKFPVINSIVGSRKLWFSYWQKEGSIILLNPNMRREWPWASGKSNLRHHPLLIGHYCVVVKHREPQKQHLLLQDFHISGTIQQTAWRPMRENQKNVLDSRVTPLYSSKNQGENFSNKKVLKMVIVNKYDHMVSL